MYQKLHDIEDIFYSNSDNHLVCLEGEKGLGKSTVLQEFSAKCENVIQIQSLASHSNYLAPVVNALHKFSNTHNIQYNEIWRKADFTYEEVILEQLIKVCTKLKCAIIFYGFANYSSELIEFVSRVIFSVLRNGNNCTVFIEIDTDVPNIETKIKTIYSIPKQFHITFDKIDSENLRQVFLEEHSDIIIAENDLEYIISSSNNNPALLNIVVNYLKSNNYISFDKGNWFCKPLKIGILSDILKNEFLSRFNRLDEIMKITLLQSSMFGMEFHVSHLENSFQIISANETLEKIQHYSKLLFQKESIPSIYSFSNSETYYFVKSFVPKEQKELWGNILYHYYRTLWEQGVQNCNQTHENYAIRIAAYATVIGKYQEAIAFYISAIFTFMRKNSYRQVLLIIDEINKLPAHKNISPLIRMHLNEFQARCFENLGLYNHACQCYKSILVEFSQMPYFDKLNVQYRLAYCTYYTSQVDKSLQLAESLERELNHSVRSDSLYYKLSSLLATIYREKGNPKFYEMFLLAINECKEKNFKYEYYVQLRKSDLCFDVNISFSMIQEAAQYFYENNFQKEYSKATHNLGVDSLYLGNGLDARKYLLESQKIFSQLGSTDEVYALNCIGVWNAILKEDYTKALNFFNEALSLQVNDFKKMTIYANIAACYQKKHLFEKCLEYIEKCQNLTAYRENNGVGFYQRTVLFAWAFYYKETKQYRLSLDMFRACWYVNLKNEQSWLAATCIIDLCKLLKLEPTNEEIQFSNINCSELYKKYYQQELLLHTLRFIE